MVLRQQKNAASTQVPSRIWQIWLITAAIGLLLLLSSCSRTTTDYKTDLGDPSLYKEFYTKVMRENESLKRKIDNLTRENSTIKEKYASLQSRTLKDGVIAEREKELDEREKGLSERKARIEQERDQLLSMRSEITDQSLETGKAIGKLEKAEEQIDMLSETLEKNQNQLYVCLVFVITLLGALFATIAYIFLDKYGVIARIQSDMSAASPITISVMSDKPATQTLEPASETLPKALSAEDSTDQS
ncbi:MAG: hypothetical protein HC860_21085 [Alkalinema sp. RU_4_3]|nr:hypothetical protein [Alkalinema sp. RU_4_3]